MKKFLILPIQDDETKTFPISDNIVMAVTGESGDTVQEGLLIISKMLA